MSEPELQKIWTIKTHSEVSDCLSEVSVKHGQWQQLLMLRISKLLSTHWCLTSNDHMSSTTGHWLTMTQWPGVPVTVSWSTRVQHYWSLA